MFQVLLSIQVVGILILAGVIVYMVPRITSKSQVLMFLFMLEAFVDSVGYLLEATAVTSETALMGTKICYIGRSYLLVTIFAYIVLFCRLKVSKFVFGILFAFQTLVLFLVLFAENNTLYYTKITFVQDGLYPRNVFNYGVVYICNQVMMYIYVLVMFTALIRKYRRSQSVVEKRKIRTLFFTLLAGIIGVLFYFTEYSQGYDTAGIGYVVGACVLAFGMFRHDVFASLEETKDRIMLNMQAGVVVLDDSDNILYHNLVADKLFPTLGTAQSVIALTDLEEYSRKGKKIFFEKSVYQVRKDEAQESGRGRIYIIPNITDSYNYTTKLESQVAEKTKELEAVTLQAISAVANTIDAKDEYTKGHSNRVAKYATILAKKLGKDENFINNLKYMALLHDIGKIGVPDSVLNKPGKLTDTEFELVKQHTLIGGEILKDITMVEGVAYGAKYHHERYDGNGYPRRLKGEEIPVEARIIGIADAYDAMTSNRVYRNKLPMDVVLKELEKGKGTQFDEEMAEVFIGLVKNGEMKVIGRDSDAEPTLLGESNQLLMNIIDKKNEQAKMESDYDYLTGLYNRKACEREITKFLKEGSGVLMLLDLDYFKNVNDTYGHLMGDYALKLAADCMKEAVPEDSIVGRQGGDEFVVFLKNHVEQEDVFSWAQRIQDTFRQKTTEEQVIGQCSFSIGVSLPGTDVDGYAGLFQQADKALYYVKQAGRNGVYMYGRKAQMSATIASTKQDIEQIADILRNSDQNNSDLPVKMKELSHVYEYTRNIANRYQYSLHVVLFSLECKAGEDTLEVLENAMNNFQIAVQKSIRGVDISTRYGSSQVIVILLDASEEGVQIAINKIMQNYYRMQVDDRISIEYDFVNLKDETAEEEAVLEQESLEEAESTPEEAAVESDEEEPETEESAEVRDEAIAEETELEEEPESLPEEETAAEPESQPEEETVAKPETELEEEPSESVPEMTEQNDKE